MPAIYIATEDELSEAILDRLVDETRGRLKVEVRIRGRGFGRLKKKLPELHRLAHTIPVILLTDLDRADCAPALIDEWFRDRRVPASFLFRVAVRELEAWLISDKEQFAAFAGVPLNRVRDDPEALGDPKQELLNLVARHSPAGIRNDVVTRQKRGPRQGLAYNERLSEFVRDAWRPEKAAERSRSLSRAIQRIHELAKV